MNEFLEMNSETIAVQIPSHEMLFECPIAERYVTLYLRVVHPPINVDIPEEQYSGYLDGEKKLAIPYKTIQVPLIIPHTGETVLYTLGSYVVYV